jgi:methylated-DNA-[protein]-cysteine S-methyltransferase
MPNQEFALFATPVGHCGIVWTARGVAGVQLPERDASATRARLRRRHPDAHESAPPGHIQQVIDDIVDLLRGEPRDLCSVTLDIDDVPPFRKQVYAVARNIPPGATLSYGDIAKRIGDGTEARDVGEAMGKNPVPIIVPCHRVLAAGGKVGGFSATGGITTKLKLLEIEGAQVGEAPTLFDSLPLMAGPRRRKG